MKNLSIKFILPLAVSILMTSCGDDDDDITNLMADAGTDQAVDLEKTVILDGSASTGSTLTFSWTLTDPQGNIATLDGATSTMPSFLATIEGSYMAELLVTDDMGDTSNDMITITVANPSYALEDQMGRPAINTVFNFFGDAMVKNGYNQTLPSEGSSNATDFEGILDALQEYIGLDSDSYNNVLGLDNTTTATVLSTDVLGCNKSASTTYGPGDLNNIVVGENVLNGRGLGDDVVDVTLILAFAADDLNNLNATQQGLISDNVQANDIAFLSEFPYLAEPH